MPSRVRKDAYAYSAGSRDYEVVLRRHASDNSRIKETIHPLHVTWKTSVSLTFEKEIVNVTPDIRIYAFEQA
jgi:hypothetical protein